MRRCSWGFADDLGRVAHLAEFFEHGFNAAGPNEQRAIREPPRDFLRELLPREALLGEHGIFREDEANAAVEFRGKSGAGIHAGVLVDRRLNCSETRVVANSVPFSGVYQRFLEFSQPE